MGSCTSADFAIALDCFAAAKYSSDGLSPSRVTKTIESLYNEADGHDITRYLCRCPKFGVTALDLQLRLAERLVQVADAS